MGLSASGGERDRQQWRTRYLFVEWKDRCVPAGQSGSKPNLNFLTPEAFTLPLVEALNRKAQRYMDGNVSSASYRWFKKLGNKVNSLARYQKVE